MRFQLSADNQSEICKRIEKFFRGRNVCRIAHAPTVMPPPIFVRVRRGAVLSRELLLVEDEWPDRVEKRTHVRLKIGDREKPGQRTNMVSSDIIVIGKRTMVVTDDRGFVRATFLKDKA